MLSSRTNMLKSSKFIGVQTTRNAKHKILKHSYEKEPSEKSPEIQRPRSPFEPSLGVGSLSSDSCKNCSISDVFLEERSSNKMVVLGPALDVLATIRRKQGIPYQNRPRLIFNSETGVEGREYYYPTEYSESSFEQANTKNDNITNKDEEGGDFESDQYMTSKGHNTRNIQPGRKFKECKISNSDYFARIKNASPKVSTRRATGNMTEKSAEVKKNNSVPKDVGKKH